MILSPVRAGKCYIEDKHSGLSQQVLAFLIQSVSELFIRD